MGVIHLVTPEYPPAFGGVASYTRQLAGALSAAGEGVHVWCPDGEVSNAYTVHPVLGQFRRADLARAGRLLDAFPTPRRILVQWVPHGYSRYAMNVAFCLWLWRRALRGDRIELMVHEPYLNLVEGNWRQTAAALVHRVMTIILLRAAVHVWMSVPAWEGMWRPYTLGRAVPFVWLPIPTALRQPDPHDVYCVRRTLADDGRLIVGHLGTYGRPVALVLERVLPELLRRSEQTRVLLMGANSDRFLNAFVTQHPHLAGRVTATGPVDDDVLSAHVAACDVLVQPYSDGISSRRTTAMAGLYLGAAIVTTEGYVTEPLWRESGAVRLAPVDRADDLTGHVIELLADPVARARVARRGRELYDRMFALERTITSLTDVPRGRAA